MFGNLELLFSMVLKLPLSLTSVVWLGIFTTGLGLSLSSLNVKYRDINFFTTAALPLIFYSTPIIWETHFAPKTILPLLYINPLTSIVEINRLIFLNEKITYLPGILISMLSSLVIVFIGNIIFKKESPFFDDWL